MALVDSFFSFYEEGSGRDRERMLRFIQILSYLQIFRKRRTFRPTPSSRG